MSKKNFIIYSTLLLALGQTCQAASIYSFSGQINSVTGWSGTPGNTYTGIGIFTGAAVSFTTSLDASKNGTRTATDGTITYLPFYEHFGVITSQDQWHRYAALISSSIDISNSSVGGEKYNLLSDSTYFSRNSTPYYSGTILLGSQLRIYKTTPYGDTSAFVENWKGGLSTNL